MVADAPVLPEIQPVQAKTYVSDKPNFGSKANVPTNIKKESAAPPTVKSLQTVSLRKKQEEVVEQATVTEDVLLVNQPFTAEALQRSWNIFIDNIKNDTHLVNAMKSCPPVLKENYEIEVTVQNQPLEKKFQDLTITIERHLHHFLKNNRIKLTIRLAEVGEMTRPFTSRDKLEAMIQKNPNMELLYRTFGLDIN
jgi:DNA polymerase III subunit gamma/tau